MSFWWPLGTLFVYTIYMGICAYSDRGYFLVLPGALVSCAVLFAYLATHLSWR